MSSASLPVSPSGVSMFQDIPASSQLKPTVNTEPHSSPGGTLNRHASATPNFSRKTVARNVDIRLRARDLFHGLVSLSWPGLLGVSVSLFLLLNIICAGFLKIQEGSVANAETYGEYLAFCIQSSATIGFGYFHPATQYAYACITLLSFLSLLVTAMFTGLVFARFSRPSGLIRFSDVCLVSTFNGKKSFQFRIANGRSQNRMIDASITVMMARDEITNEGLTMRRFYEIPVIRDKSPNFSVMWLVVSDLEHEPNVLKDISEENASFYFRNIVVNLSGYDLETCQTVYESHVYFPSHVRFHHQFSDMVSMDASQTIIVDHAKINSIVPYTAPPRTEEHKNYSPKLAPAHGQEQFVPDITTPMPTSAGFNFAAKQPSITGRKHVSEMN